MATAPRPAPLFDWPRLSELAGLSVRRRAVLDELGTVRPRSERAIVLRAQLRELTEQQLRLGVGGRHD